MRIDTGTGRGAADGADDRGAPTTLLLLRHGETALTPQKRLSGSGGSDPALSPAGRRQAEAAGRMLAARGAVRAVVSSPLRRARQTAEAAARGLGLEVRVDERLTEADFGAWEGLTFAEVRERHPQGGVAGSAAGVETEGETEGQAPEAGEALVRRHRAGPVERHRRVRPAAPSPGRPNITGLITRLLQHHRGEPPLTPDEAARSNPAGSPKGGRPGPRMLAGPGAGESERAKEAS